MVLLKQILLIGIIGFFLTGCSQFGVLLSAGSFAASQNSFVKVYNAADFGVALTTKKGIKTHLYEKGKKYIYDKTWGLTHD